MNWISTNKETYNIKSVLCVGDIVDTVGVSSQWAVADSAFDILDTAEIPYLATNGNHDIDLDTTLTTFNSYFPTTRYSSHAWFNGGFRTAGHSETGYIIVDYAGTSYILITLQYAPIADDLTWLDNLLTTHSDKKAIVITHSYLGTIDAGLQNSRNSIGDSIWTILKTHPNSFFVESGHVANDGVGRLTSIGDSGNIVNQVVANYQGEDGSVGGSGAIRLVTVDHGNSIIHVQTVATGINKLYTDEKNQFSLPT